MKRDDTPRRRRCPNCQAKAGEPCTQPTDRTRIPVNWYHYARRAGHTKERS